MLVYLTVKNDKSGPGRTFELTAGKNTDNYHKFAAGKRGAEVIATAYISKKLNQPDKPAKKS